jgi:hypothetical protein
MEKQTTKQFVGTMGMITILMAIFLIMNYIRLFY